MFTQEEKKMLLDLLNSVQIRGTRETIGQTLEKIDVLTKKIEALPVEPAKDGDAKETMATRLEENKKAMRPHRKK